MDLRCENGIKFAELSDQFIEMKCRSRKCGKESGVVVIHRFDHSGNLIKTMRFRDPERNQHGNPIRPA